MEGLLPFAAAFGLIALLELGDKTQLVTISLATRHPWKGVLAGAVVGLTAATAIGAAVGGVLAATLGAWLTYIRIGGGVLFIVIGGWTVAAALRRHVAGEPEEAVKEKRRAFVTATSFNFLAEFGDKTQIAVIVLAATYDAPFSVFLGGSAGMALIAVTSVAIGKGLSRFMSERWLRLLSTGLFIVAGVLLIVEAFFEL
ncbi:MAG TPA: TMEM165/GDT1 family protein [Thermoplasmata archaeon]|nr:TMEM165/GDT1 family protein [Thermoplasmata archaeon]